MISRAGPALSIHVVWSVHGQALLTGSGGA